MFYAWAGYWLGGGIGFGGCGRGATAEIVVTVGEFWEMMWGKDVDLAMGGGDEWTARAWVAVDPPMDGILIDAMADPFSETAEWVKPGMAKERADMLGRLKSWRDSALKEKGRDEGWPEEEVSSRFGVVVAALVLESRLLALSGDEAGARSQAIETLVVAREAVESAPGLVKADIFPSFLIAAEAVTQFQLEPDEVSAVLEQLDLNLVETIGNSIDGEFNETKLSGILELLNGGRDAAEVLVAVDPMELGGESGVQSELQKLLDGARSVVNIEKSAQLAKELYESKAPATFDELRTKRAKLDERVVSAWGIDVLSQRPEKWDMAMVGKAVGASDNAVGVLVFAQIERNWMTKIESAYMTQMNLDAIRMSLGGKYGVEIELVDRLTGEPYVVDQTSGVLRSSLVEVDPQFIFVNQIVQNGVPLL
ncbi:hypothetical protein CCB80_00010 [Armatimonadetes bacterium Uphvl-Ar1]|nr:hypothetical protein CCB80_00010 [Armatimonadetes bacterium Uphvl-Ar1]